MILDLYDFCESDAFRTRICHPWEHDGFTYATDGRMMIRVPSIGFLREAFTDEPPPNEAKPFEAFAKVREWRDLPALDNRFRVYAEDVDGEGDMRIRHDHIQQVFPEHIIAYKYALKLQQLPGCEVGIYGETQIGKQASQLPLCARFDGGEAVVMGINLTREEIEYEQERDTWKHGALATVGRTL